MTVIGRVVRGTSPATYCNRLAKGTPVRCNTAI